MIETKKIINMIKTKKNTNPIKTRTRMHMTN